MGGPKAAFDHLRVNEIGHSTCSCRKLPHRGDVEPWCWHGAGTSLGACKTSLGAVGDASRSVHPKLQDIHGTRHYSGGCYTEVAGVIVDRARRRHLEELACVHYADAVGH